MIPLDQLPAWEPATGRLQAVIEAPRGSRNKYKYDPATGQLRLNKVLPVGAAFPLDYGFIPSTCGEDGDPIDVLVVMDEPAFPGCVVTARLVGAIEAEQTENGNSIRNDRLVAVLTPRATPRRFTRWTNWGASPSTRSSTSSSPTTRQRDERSSRSDAVGRKRPRTSLPPPCSPRPRRPGRPAGALDADAVLGQAVEVDARTWSQPCGLRSSIRGRFILTPPVNACRAGRACDHLSPARGASARRPAGPAWAGGPTRTARG
jgi:hypothetical protein